MPERAARQIALSQQIHVMQLAVHVGLEVPHAHALRVRHREGALAGVACDISATTGMKMSAAAMNTRRSTAHALTLKRAYRFRCSRAVSSS